MPQKDSILRVADDVGRALAQIIYHQDMQDYQGALSLIDEECKQSVGMGSGFIHAISDETL
jgi:hypothetical protein